MLRAYEEKNVRIPLQVAKRVFGAPAQQQRPVRGWPAPGELQSERATFVR